MKHKECDDLMWILDQVARYSHDVDAIFWLNSSRIKSVGLFFFFSGNTPIMLILGLRQTFILFKTSSFLKAVFFRVKLWAWSIISLTTTIIKELSMWKRQHCSNSWKADNSLLSRSIYDSLETKLGFRPWVFCAIPAPCQYQYQIKWKVTELNW